MLWVGLGNLVGGAVFVGLAYWVIGGAPRWPSVQTLRPEEAQASV
jgi:nitrite transporter NirC